MSANNKVYEKLLKVRKAESLSLKPSKWLKQELTLPDGSVVPFKLRNYQIQLVIHALLMRRFVIGEDTGLGKCETGVQLLNTSSGLVRLEDMHDWSGMKPDTFEPIDKDWEVVVGGEALPVKNFYYGGKKPTIKVKTRYQFELEGTLVHPLLVWRDGEHVWVQLQDLVEGDYLCVERRADTIFPENEPVLDTEVETKGDSAVYKVPTEMSPDFARFLAYYIGEGALTEESSVEVCQCPKKNPEIHKDIISLARQLFGYEVSRKDTPHIQIYSTYLRKFLYQNGLIYCKSPQRTVPDCVLRSTRESNIEFLRGIFEAEASVLKCGGIEFSSASEELAKQLQIMLLRFGIVARRRDFKVKGYDQNTYWKLTIFGQDARNFRDRIGFISSRKIEDLEVALRDRATNANHDVIPNSKELIEDLRALLKEAVKKTGSNANRKGSGFKKYGVSFVNTLSHIRNNGRNPTYDFLSKFLDIAKENGLERTSPYQKLKEIEDLHYFYDPIESFEHGEEEVFDIEVDDPRHCYVANGLMSHNTLETIATLCYIWEKEPDIIPIIVTNTSAMRQWGGEIDKFTEGVQWVVAEGRPKDRYAIYDRFFKTWSPEEPSVLILNYPRLNRDHRHIKEHLEGRKYLLALDEVTAVKSTETQTHKVCRELSENAERVYGLTATLIKNNLEEGFGIYKVVLPELFGTKKGFMRDYCVTRKQPLPGRRGRGRKVDVIVGHSKEHIRKFREKIDPYYLGRAKHVVAKDLPVLTTREIYSPVTSGQWEQYLEALSGLLNIKVGTEEEEEKEVTKLTQLIYTQQIVNSPHLIGNEGSSAKEDYLLELLKEELFGEKVIVFTRFKEMVNRLQGLLEKDGYGLGIKREGRQWVPGDSDVNPGKGLVRITGDESSEMRDASRRAFTEGENTNIIFLTMAGAEAINLQQARVMIFYDLPWSAGDYLQLVGRMIRIGSPHQRVYAMHLIAEGPNGEKTIDHHVLGTLQKKMGWIEGTLGKRLVAERAGSGGGGGDDDDIPAFIASSDVNDLFEMLAQEARSLT